MQAMGACVTNRPRRLDLYMTHRAALIDFAAGYLKVALVVPVKFYLR